MIDKNGKIFSKISIIDLILIFAVVLACIGITVKMTNMGKVAQVKSDTKFYVTFKVENVRQYSLDAVTKGDVFYEKNGPLLGTVSDISNNQYTEIATKLDGTSKLSDSPEKYDIYITLLCEGKESDTGFFVSGTRQVAHGSEVKLRSMKFSADSIVEKVYY